MARNDSSANGDREILGSLPRHRASRRSTKRDPSASAAKAKAQAQAQATPATADTPARAKVAAKPKAAKKAGAAPKAKAAAKPKAKAPARPSATTKARSRPAARTRPADTAVAARPGIPPAGYAAPRAGESSEVRRDSGHGPVQTAVQAAGELAQIGITLSGQALKSAIRRLPRP